MNTICRDILNHIYCKYLNNINLFSKFDDREISFWL